ncbi:hypothetical protein Y032_0158g3247 [Ancylostoma ceylanicum]|uniref:Uncharacterized protein n=1 Tax=Ancylostoma ceylanicum TaxID=53326 RepID=A0A016SXZ3_9BILA|nr:hypothetical protein Y032_0158g3247 [Ancylostoma ceylanicum]
MAFADPWTTACNFNLCWNNSLLVTATARSASKVRALAMISMYKTSYDGRTYFVYWLPDPKVIGVCNGASEVYELTVSEKDRAEFVNVSETILPTIWREIMCNKAFNLSSISESNCIVTFGTKKSLTLPVNSDPLRLAFIMEEMLKCIEVMWLI